MAGITVGLSGGLGNQLFQYAMGLSLSLQNNVPLALDLYAFEIDRHYQRKYGLGAFDIRDAALTRLPFEFWVARALRVASSKVPVVGALSRRWFILEGS